MHDKAKIRSLQATINAKDAQIRSLLAKVQHYESPAYKYSIHAEEEAQEARSGDE